MTARLTPRNCIVIIHAGTPLALRPLAVPSTDIVRQVNERLPVENLEDDQDLQDLALGVFHSTTHTFTATPAVKIIENHLGNAYVRTEVQQQTRP